jgi:hypothetical protein
MMKGVGTVVKNPGRVKFTDLNTKLWTLEIDGSALIGKKLMFTRRDHASRNNAKGERTIASLRVIEAFGDIPEDKAVRVPCDCFCGIEHASR